VESEHSEVDGMKKGVDSKGEVMHMYKCSDLAYLVTCTIITALLQVQSCGTAFQLICDKLTLAFNDLSCY